MRDFFVWLVQEAHPLTWVITVLLDLTWNLFDSLSIFSGFGILCYPFVMAAIFLLCFVPVVLIQHYVSGDEWSPALNKATTFGILAALPFSVVTLIAGGVGLAVRESRGRDYTYSFGRFGITYRELEKIIKQAAFRTGRVSGDWRELKMESAINALEECGEISPAEARELHQLRVARNNAHHVETPADLDRWVQEAERLFEKYRERFGV